MAADQIVDRAVAAKAGQVGEDADHVGERTEGLGGEFGEPRVIKAAGCFEEPEVAALVERVEFGNFAQGVFDRAAVVEGPALVVNHAVPRCDWEEFDVVGPLFTEEGEQFVEEERCSQHSGAGIIKKSVAAEDAGPAAVIGLAFEQGDLLAKGTESQGGGESAEAGADDESAGGGVGGGHKPPPKVN